jgi:hypothetical protein
MSGLKCDLHSSSVKNKSTTTAVPVILPRKELGVRYLTFDAVAPLKLSMDVSRCLLATSGILVQENYHFQGYISPSQGLIKDIPNGALDGLVQIAVLIGFHEFF